MDWTGKKVMVMGMAKSGVSAAKLLLRHGAQVMLSDSKELSSLGADVGDLLDLGAEDLLGKNPSLYLDDVKTIVISPGIPLTNPIFEEARKRDIAIIAEIELGFLMSKAPIVAIGGTNGKTTTTALTGEIFRLDSKKVEVLGNIGDPLCQGCENVDEDGFIIAEIASLQLETTKKFRPKSAVLLNISEDHLDRFKTMEYYTQVKTMMFHNQEESDFAVINADDEISTNIVKPHIKARLLEFSLTKDIENGSCISNGILVFRMDGHETEIIPIDKIKIRGKHNLENSLAAVAVSMPLGISARACAEALESFAGVEHRIESFAEIDGVEYVNDSKATNPVSSVKAVEAMDKPTVLLLGGSNKNSDYLPVFRAFNGKVKAVVAYGETKNQLLRDAETANYANIHVIDEGFEKAVKIAINLAQSGDVVLLSPACASYDEFDNFEQRGRVFKELVTRNK